MHEKIQGGAVYSSTVAVSWWVTMRQWLTTSLTDYFCSHVLIVLQVDFPTQFLCKPAVLSGDEAKWRLSVPPSPPLPPLNPCLFPDSSVAVPVSCAASFPMDLRVGERGMRPGSDTALLTPLHPPLLLTQFSPQPCAPFSQQQLHQQIRVNYRKHRDRLLE